MIKIRIKEKTCNGLVFTAVLKTFTKFGGWRIYQEKNV